MLLLLLLLGGFAVLAVAVVHRRRATLLLLLLLLLGVRRLPLSYPVLVAPQQRLLLLLLLLLLLVVLPVCAVGACHKSICFVQNLFFLFDIFPISHLLQSLSDIAPRKTLPPLLLLLLLRSAGAQSQGWRRCGGSRRCLEKKNCKTNQCKEDPCARGRRSSMLLKKYESCSFSR